KSPPRHFQIVLIGAVWTSHGAPAHMTRQNARDRRAPEGGVRSNQTGAGDVTRGRDEVTRGTAGGGFGWRPPGLCRWDRLSRDGGESWPRSPLAVGDRAWGQTGRSSRRRQREVGLVGAAARHLERLLRVLVVPGRHLVHERPAAARRPGVALADLLGLGGD